MLLGAPQPQLEGEVGRAEIADERVEFDVTALVIEGEGLPHQAWGKGRVPHQDAVVGAPGIVGVALPWPPRLGAGAVETLDLGISKGAVVEIDFIDEALE